MINVTAIPPNLATSDVATNWLNKGDNACQLTAATLVGLQSIPGLVILYSSIVKKKWAVNSAFMALYTFTAVLICWVVWAFEMSFGDQLLPFWGKPGFALGQRHLLAEDTSFTGLYLRHMHTCSEPPLPSSSTPLDSPSPPHSTALLSYG